LRAKKKSVMTMIIKLTGSDLANSKKNFIFRKGNRFRAHSPDWVSNMVSCFLAFASLLCCEYISLSRASSRVTIAHNLSPSHHRSLLSLAIARRGSPSLSSVTVLCVFRSVCVLNLTTPALRAHSFELYILVLPDP